MTMNMLKKTAMAGAIMLAVGGGLSLVHPDRDASSVPLVLLPFGTPAHAVVGRPATPVSYAGVARRTARRTTRRVNSRYD